MFDLLDDKLSSCLWQNPSTVNYFAQNIPGLVCFA